MKKYGAYVTTISKEILAGKGTKEDVEEVVSDVFISLWNTAERIDCEKYTSIKAYIGMIARNKAKDKIRAIKSWNLELYDDVLLIDNQAEKTHGAKGAAEDHSETSSAIEADGSGNLSFILLQIF